MRENHGILQLPHIIEFDIINSRFNLFAQVINKYKNIDISSITSNNKYCMNNNNKNELDSTIFVVYLSLKVEELESAAALAVAAVGATAVVMVVLLCWRR